MPSILLKYLLKRWLFPLLGGVLFFGGLLVANDIVQVSRDIFAQGAPIKWLVPILLTTLPETLALVLPMAAILGGLMGTQQLSEGSELVASQGLGVGTRVILRAWALLSLGLVLVASLNAHRIVPSIGRNLDRIEDRMAEDTKTRFLRPGAPPFFPPQRPQTGIWVAPTGEVHFLDVSDTEVQHLVAKDMAWNREDAPDGRSTIILKLLGLKGCYFHRGNQSVGLLDQKTQSLPIELPPRREILVPTPVRYLATSELLKLRSRDCWIELERRITLPFCTAAFLLLGVAMGLHHPRLRKGGALIRSLAVILLYYTVLKLSENLYLAGKIKEVFLFLPPLIFLGAGLVLLAWKMRPGRAQRFSWNALLRRGVLQLRRRLPNLPDLLPDRPPTRAHIPAPGILGRWARRLWWKNWGATIGTLLTLDLLIEFARLAGEISKNDVSAILFLRYWLWNLPSFLVVALPVSFLLGGVLAFSEAAVSKEWVSLRAGGTSLLQWIGAGSRAWMSVLAFSLILQALVAPAMIDRANALRREIKQRPAGQVHSVRPWMHLTSTGVLWFLERDHRWGFPLVRSGEAPILYHWKPGDRRVEELPWDGLHFVEGPEVPRLFPSGALLRSASAEETSTWDLFLWQKWAPDAERATLLWGRLLNWLAGPCLLFAMLAFAFPSPRGSRGQALGYSLVLGLGFLGLQGLLNGAARAGEIPALWGVVAPLLVLLGTGFLNLGRLKT